MSDSIFRFGSFELDRDNFQLRASGQSVRLQKVPLELLLMLAEREGRLVTRHEITERIWGKDVFLDADSAVSTAIRKIRHALNDNPNQPKYIETVPGKGYRFIAQVRSAYNEIRSIETDLLQCRPTIAVLPLEDYSDDAESYFSEGLTEEILTHLGRLHPQLAVISRTSVMKYKDTRKSMRQIGRELGVAYALEGSVRRHSGRVRISMQLIETLHQMHIWAENYEYPLDDILELQDRLAREIATQISLQLKVDAPTVIAPTVRIDREAYEAYLRGRYFWNQRVEPALIQSIASFEEAIALEPRFAAAHAGLADAHIFLCLHGLRLPAETYPKAEQAARTALELDSSIPDGYLSLALIQNFYYWNWPAAKPLLLRALQLNPSHVQARFYYGGMLSEIGEDDEAIRQIGIARALDPLSVITQAFAGYVRYRSRDYVRAADEVQRSLDLDPRFPPSYWYLGLIRQELGDPEGAIDALKLAVEFSLERPLYLAHLGHALGIANRKEEAVSVLNKLTKLSLARYVSPFDIALVHMGLGDKETTLGLLEEACGQRVTRMRTLREALFDTMRSEPRFVELMRRAGLPE